MLTGQITFPTFSISSALRHIPSAKCTDTAKDMQFFYIFGKTMSLCKHFLVMTKCLESKLYTIVFF